MVKYRRLTKEEQSKAIARANQVAIRWGKKKAPSYVIKAIRNEKRKMTPEEIRRAKKYREYVKGLIEADIKRRHE